ncbi:facilitated trehalose transporter Tret1-like isoform X1 [Anthonomus grandis grandis]|uniref:facilitated trehalose transporter Tret1-like isoform X1 n=1 Tax=Anthonomus grandis grandis TaxID=2921223 RepID=UPI0021663ED0|nr:facilitated trehalose transporter Tret1-like isoform X1 [Anthonomus grandis grandis]
MHLFVGNFRFYFIVLTVNIISLMSGMMLTWPSPILPKLSSNESLDQNPIGRVITSSELSWIAALSSIGGIVGPLFTGLIMEKFGRKLAIACTHIPNLISCLLSAFGNDVWYFYIARVASGMSIYAGVSLGAIYFGEVGRSETRGILYSTTSIFINLGTLLSYCIGPYTSIRDFNLILFAIVLTGMIGTLIYVPESPYFLVQKGEFEKARQSLEVLRGTSNVEDEIGELKMDMSKIPLKDGVFFIFKAKAARKSFVLALVLIILQQFSGINVIYSYTQLIFEQSGSKLSSDVSSILVGVAQFCTIFITTFGVDRFGRKKMLTFASGGLAFTLGILATYFRFQDLGNENTSSINWLPLVCLILFFVFFNSGMGGLPFLYMSEILPSNVKSASSSIIMAVYCLMGFLITYFYNDIINKIQASGGFYVFAGSMVIFAVYVMIVLFETKGKTLQEINDHLSKSKRSKEAFPSEVKETIS